MFRRAIVRPPGPSFARGLTTQSLGAPSLPKALAQHAAYRRALEAAGLEVLRLPADPEHPDSTFVEDTAVLFGPLAVLGHPGAPARRGEVAAMRPVLEPYFSELASIEPPGTLDGGDVCDAGAFVLIGLSARTDQAGARQLGRLLARHGRESRLVPLPAAPGLLHLKSGLTWLGGKRLLVVDPLADAQALAGYELVHVPPGEAYAANCVWLGDRLVVAAGYPLLEAHLRALGYDVVALDMSEMEKMDGGLSCLSLRF